MRCTAASGGKLRDHAASVRLHMSGKACAEAHGYCDLTSLFFLAACSQGHQKGNVSALAARSAALVDASTVTITAPPRRCRFCVTSPRKKSTCSRNGLSGSSLSWKRQHRSRIIIQGWLTADTSEIRLKHS